MKTDKTQMCNERMEYWNRVLTADGVTLPNVVFNGRLGRRMLGKFIPSMNLIEINDNLDLMSTAATLDHEFSHAIVYHMHKAQYRREQSHGRTFKYYMAKMGYDRKNYSVGDKATIMSTGFTGEIIKIGHVRIYVKVDTNRAAVVHADSIIPASGKLPNDAPFDAVEVSATPKPTNKPTSTIKQGKKPKSTPKAVGKPTGQKFEVLSAKKDKESKAYEIKLKFPGQSGVATYYFGAEEIDGKLYFFTTLHHNGHPVFRTTHLYTGDRDLEYLQRVAVTKRTGLRYLTNQL